MKHAEALELLPWFAADSLEAAERDAVQNHVDECRECADELVELKLVHAAVAEDGAEEPAYNPKLVDVVLRRIDELEATESKMRVTNIFSRLGARLQWAATPQFARLALAAQLFMVIGLAAVLLLRTPVATTEYNTSSGNATVTTGERFSVVFRANVSVDQLNRTLAPLQLSIVGGPSALGLYTVATTADIDPALVVQRLESTGLTTFVAPVPK